MSNKKKQLFIFVDYENNKTFLFHMSINSIFLFRIIKLIILSSNHRSPTLIQIYNYQNYIRKYPWVELNYLLLFIMTLNRNKIKKKKLQIIPTLMLILYNTLTLIVFLFFFFFLHSFILHLEKWIKKKMIEMLGKLHC